MPTKIIYKVVTETVEKIDEEVNKMLDDGWELNGELKVNELHNINAKLYEAMAYQPMLKRIQT